jgi:hypothetical protein
LCTPCTPRSDKAEEEVLGSETRVHIHRYAANEVDTNEKKHECFLNGLNDGLAYALEARDFENFHGMVNKAIVLENRRGVIERKHKLVH